MLHKTYIYRYLHIYIYIFQNININSGREHEYKIPARMTIISKMQKQNYIIYNILQQLHHIILTNFNHLHETLCISHCD